MFFLSGPKGFTLLEVVVAMVILAVALLGLAGLQIISLQGNSLASQLTEATTLAQDQLEQLITTPFSTLTDGANNVTGATGVGYNVQWDITPDDLTGATRANITVSVSWTQDVPHTVSVNSVISQF
ncbi:MAG: prepilin-type N-terminal cleavage/methylation domain-containing protein [Proteobacteria bacterium]|nr:prepilin-type N-terminal cleavage/methylation domain-containing protein [Pseudomonadota bacterium]